jgi:hypothetical protein
MNNFAIVLLMLSLLFFGLYTQVTREQAVQQTVSRSMGPPPTCHDCGSLMPALSR